MAEASITIGGVRVVVDSGLARRPRYDRGRGLTRLVTERVSRAAANQRAGRAGRQAPGVAYRLWEEQQTASLPPRSEEHTSEPQSIMSISYAVLCLKIKDRHSLISPTQYIASN